MSRGRSSLRSKRFYLYAFLAVIMLAVLLIINVIFDAVREQDAVRGRQSRFDALVNVYNDDYTSITQTLFNLSGNNLVQSLRYHSSFLPDTSAKIKALINAVSLADSAMKDNVHFFLYFHDSDSVISATGRLWIDEFRNNYLIDDDFDLAALREDRSARIGIYRQAILYKNNYYNYRSLRDHASLYAYTSDGVTLIAISDDGHIVEMIDGIVSAGDGRYVIWDTETDQALYTNIEGMGDTAALDEAKLRQFLPPGGTLITEQIGRFLFGLWEADTASSDLGYKFTLYMGILSAALLAMLAAYYLILEVNVFLPLKRILTTLPEKSRSLGLYEQIEDALRALGEGGAQDDAPPTEQLLRRSLIGLPQEIDAPPDQPYLCVGVAAETDGERDAAVRRIEDTTHGRLLGVLSNFALIYVPLDEARDEDAVCRALDAIEGRVAMGVSRKHASIGDISEAYSETAGVFRAPCDRLPLVSRADQGVGEDEIGLPMDAREAETLLGHILAGRAEEAQALVGELLDETASGSIDRKRYVTVFLLNLFELAHNGTNRYVYDMPQLMDSLRNTLDYSIMREIVVSTCASLAEAFTPTDDSLITFMTSYVEEHYAENINLHSVADQSGFSYAYVSHYFSEKKGVSFTDYLNAVRVDKARALLEETDLLVGEIPERTGFGSMNTFARNFKKFMGTTPEAYRKAHALTDTAEDHDKTVGGA